MFLRNLVFFLTGAAALCNQILWSRLLGRVLGNDSFGVGLVLCVFMGGLGAGSLCIGRLPPLKRPTRVLALALGSIALCALASYPLLLWVEALEGQAWRGLAAGCCLLLPTFCMGCTFPLMGELLRAEEPHLGQRVAGFYASNTFGAAAGTLLCSFVLLPRLDLYWCLVSAAALDVMAALLALLLFKDPALEGHSVASTGRVPVRFLLAAAVSGLCGLALEVLGTRLLVALTGTSVYAFALILFVFLCGIALGSQGLRGRNPKQTDPLHLARLALVLIPLCFVLGICLLAKRIAAPQLFEGAANLSPHSGEPLILWISHVSLAALLLFPAALALGASLPALIAAAAANLGTEREERSSARLLGQIYAANTLGAMLGAGLAAFVWLPRLGLRTALVCSLACALIAAACLPGQWHKLARLAGAGSLVALGLLALWKSGDPSTKTLFAKAGPLSTAAVEQNLTAHGVVRALRVDGKVVASSAPIDLRLQHLLGTIPAWWHAGVERALVIGLGTGMTAGALLEFPSLKELEVVEISTAVVEACAWFEAWNNGLLKDPRTQVIMGDGRHHVRHTRRTYDLVTSDPIHPWTRGSADLYTLEHFEAMARCLSPGGVASQWLPLYQLSELDVQTVIATWNGAFEYSAAYLTAYDLALLGSREPNFDWPAGDLPELPLLARESLARLGLADACALAALAVADRAGLEHYAKQVAPMLERHPLLEFRAPLSFQSGYARPSLYWAGRPEFLAQLPACAASAARATRAALMRFLEAPPADWQAAAERYGVELLEGTRQ